MVRRQKPASRLELREAAAAAEKKAKSKEKDAAKPKKEKAAKEKTKTPAAKKPAKKRASKKKPVATRMRRVWGVFDNGNNQVATYSYLERASADKRAADLTAKGKGGYFVQPVNEPIEEPLEAEAT